MKRTFLIGLIFASCVGLSACSNMSSETKGTLIGAGLGAAAGGLIFDSPVGAAAGAAVGGGAGYLIGRDN